MATEPTHAQKSEFERLRAFVQVAFDGMFDKNVKLRADDHPSNVTEKMWADSPTKALDGLRAAVSDLIEMARDLDAKAVNALETRLADAGAPSLACLRERRAQRIFQVLHQGEIRSADEAELVNGILTDETDRVLDAPGRDLATRILGAYSS